jgi:glycolate oxidase iron-sulfur subunit
LLGDERDGPRGRIYLIKQVLEGAPATARTQTHLDRCLTCRNCETTCPSGVEYGHLLDIGRKVVAQQVQRPWRERTLRQLLLLTLPRPALMKPLFALAYALRPALPRVLQQKLPPRDASTRAGIWPDRPHARKMLILEGCVQPGMAPNINAATARVLDKLGVQLLRAPKAGCCGALRQHLSAEQAALQDMRNNIDAWWPYLQGRDAVEAIVMTASGCGVMLKEYGYHLAHDAQYAAKAARVAALTRDISEVLVGFAPQLQQMVRASSSFGASAEIKLAYHPPCTLQHGQQLRGQVESLLRGLGVTLSLPCDSHTCCGSAGTYSVLQPELANSLRANKLANLQASGPDTIVTANIGCIAHLQGGTATPVRHWIELVARIIA